MTTDNMENKVFKTVKKHNMISPEDTVVVGLSGGADSVALLVCLNSLKERLGIEKIVACHVNHNLRETAKRDEIFAGELCERLGVEFYLKSVDIKELKDKLKVCEEEAGRIARYEFFHEIKNKFKNGKIATAHNFNDQIETFFIRLLRGASSEGLISIKPYREDGVIRPLIEVKREEIEIYLKGKNQGYVTDETNLKTDYQRNKIRLMLIPYLKENFGFKEEIIADNIELFKRDSEYISKEVLKTMEKGLRENKRIVFPLDILKKKDDAVLSRVIKNAVSETFGIGISKKQTDSVMKMIRDGVTGKRQTLSSGICACTDYDKFKISLDNTLKKYEYTVFMGENRIDEIESVAELTYGSSKSTDFIKISSPDNILVRCRKNGDRVYIKGVGHKKVKDIFIDKKISREIRDNYPIFLQNDEIVWIPGLYKREEKDGSYRLAIRRMGNENK